MVRKAYEDGITGLAAMVAYNLLLSIFPLALVALYIAGRVLESPELSRSILLDLEQLFPTTTRTTLQDGLVRLRDGAGTFGLIAVVASIWFGSSFWGALDTAFCRIYHLRCRSWLEQKRFALAMLVVVLAFLAATVLVPTLQSILAAGADDLPLGLDELDGLVYGVTLAAGVVVLFAIMCVIYRAVPNQRVPWCGVWPGALAATVAMAIVDYAFPLYLSNVSTITRLGSSVVFILIALLWFYALALIMLGGAVVNAARLARAAA